jgi:hypothetical protein
MSYIHNLALNSTLQGYRDAQLRTLKGTVWAGKRLHLNMSVKIHERFYTLHD